MPVCPQCASEFHALAHDQCPSCGYSLTLCDQVYGDGYFDLMRVNDPAGALKQADIDKLSRYLQTLEKRLAPAALVVYLTDQGQSSTFSQHAHWVLNHGRISPASFGKRSTRSIPAPSPHALRLRGQGEDPLFLSLEHSNPLSRLWRRFKKSFYNPIPPVETRWILMLVLDVQLQATCFSWGYMLDPYIQSAQLDKCIRESRLQFREKSLYASIKQVMKRAVKQLAAHAHTVNRELREGQRILAPIPPPSSSAPLRQKATSKLVLDVEQAKREHEQLLVERERLALQHEKLLAQQEQLRLEQEHLDKAAAEQQQRSWRQGNHSLLLPLALATQLLSPTEWSEKDTQALYQQQQAARYLQALPTQKVRRPNVSPKLSSPAPLKDFQIINHLRQHRSLLIDPHQLLSRPERQELEHRLQLIKSQSPYRVYVIIHAGTQNVAESLKPQQLLNHAGESGHYAAFIEYHIGQQRPLEIAYSLIPFIPQQQEQLLHQLRHAASLKATDSGAIHAALDTLQQRLNESSHHWDASSTHSRKILPKLDIPWRSTPTFQKEKKLSLARSVSSGDIGVLGWIILSFLGSTLGYMLLRRWYCSHAELYVTRADERLSSPTGAGVSRQIRYMEAREIAPSRTPMMGPQQRS